jgi:hypothetical protein
VPSSLELLILLPQTPKCWDYRYALPSHFCCYCLFVCSSGIWTQGFLLASRCSIAWAMPPALFALVILEIGSCFLPCHPRMWFFYFTMPSFFVVVVEMVSPKLFSPGVWPRTVILQISNSCIAWDDRCMPLHPASSWDGVLWIFCSGWPPATIPWSQSPT